MREKKDLNGISLLGSGQTKYDSAYNPGILETFDNKHPEEEYVVSFFCPEFTSLCPKTGQPDFAKILIRYIPRKKMVESKSLKLYLFSFRNNGDFHEDCVNMILKDLKSVMNPRYIEVMGLFMPRGGIAIHPYANWGDTKHRKMAEARRHEVMFKDWNMYPAGE